MNNRRKPRYKTVTMTGSDVPLSTSDFFLTFWIKAPWDNGGDVTLKDDASGSVILSPGDVTPVHEGINLADISANGAGGDTVQVYGYTPWS